MLNDAIAIRLKRATGLDLARTAVDCAVRRRMKDSASRDRDAYLHGALRDADELNALIDLVVVPESWFFRDAEAFAAAVAFVRKRLADPLHARPLRLLCLPCASGEEPASLAIALLDAGIDARDFVIVAVDVSPRSIERVRRGIYQRNAFRTADLAFRDRHFTNDGSGYELNTAVRAQIHSHCGNLLTLENPAPSEAFDVVFCRNLLIYFDEATQRAAIRKLNTLLADGGLLFTGYAEAPTFCRQGFVMVNHPKAFALKRKTAAEAETISLSEPPPRRRPVAARAPAPMVTAAPSLLRLPGPATAPAPAPVTPKALLDAARRLADAGKTAEAGAKYRDCLKTAPDCVEAYFMLGLLSERVGERDAAADLLRRAVYLDPGHYEALCHLALLAEYAGQARDATLFRQRAARVFERRRTEAQTGR